MFQLSLAGIQGLVVVSSIQEVYVLHGWPCFMAAGSCTLYRDVSGWNFWIKRLFSTQLIGSGGFCVFLVSESFRSVSVGFDIYVILK